MVWDLQSWQQPYYWNTLPFRWHKPIHLRQLTSFPQLRVFDHFCHFWSHLTGGLSIIRELVSCEQLSWYISISTTVIVMIIFTLSRNIWRHVSLWKCHVPKDATKMWREKSWSIIWRKNVQKEQLPANIARLKCNTRIIRYSVHGVLVFFTMCSISNEPNEALLPNGQGQ